MNNRSIKNRLLFRLFSNLKQVTKQKQANKHKNMLKRSNKYVFKTDIDCDMEGIDGEIDSIDSELSTVQLQCYRWVSIIFNVISIISCVVN